MVGFAESITVTMPTHCALASPSEAVRVTAWLPGPKDAFGDWEMESGAGPLSGSWLPLSTLALPRHEAFAGTVTSRQRATGGRLPAGGASQVKSTEAEAVLLSSRHSVSRP